MLHENKNKNLEPYNLLTSKKKTRREAHETLLGILDGSHSATSSVCTIHKVIVLTDY